MHISLYVGQQLMIFMIFRVAPNRKYWLLARTCDKNRGVRVRQDEHEVTRAMTMGGEGEG